jgi:hypothetical protein
VSREAFAEFVISAKTQHARHTLARFDPAFWERGSAWFVCAWR